MTVNAINGSLLSGFSAVDGVSLSTLSEINGQALAATTDPHYASVVLLCHFDGVDAATTTTDEKGHALTVNGNAQIDTAQSKFGGSSSLFDGAGDYWSAADSADWELGSGDFTLECWVRFSSVAAGDQYFLAHNLAGGNQRSWVWRYTEATTKMSFVYSTTGVSTTALEATWIPSTGQWYHIAVVRATTSLEFFVDGTSLGTASIGASSLFDSSAVLAIGSDTPGNSVAGWLDDVRITKGVARYSGSYAVPTAAFPNA